MMRALIIDDDPFVCDILESLLARLDLKVDAVHTLHQGLLSAQRTRYDLLFLDVFLPDGDGFEHLDLFLANPSPPAVIGITGAGDSTCVETALHRGAQNYILKPIVVNDVLQATRQALARQRPPHVQDEKRRLDAIGIVGRSASLQASLATLLQVAATDADCLICGQAGTGKELFARGVHVASSRAGKSFVVVDCTDIRESLAERVLFGHLIESSSDSCEMREGLFKQADGGTLFLDEIGELPLGTQESLLRVLQERRFRPIGAKVDASCDFRLVASTNCNLAEMVQQGCFRQELLRRLSAMTITLPPLKDRIGDIPLLAQYFLEKYCRQLKVAGKSMSSSCLQALEAYSWPENVRELSNVIQSALVLSVDDAVLELFHLPMELRANIKKRRLDDIQAEKELFQDFSYLQPSFFEAGEFPSFKEIRAKGVNDVERLYFTRLLDHVRNGQEEACRVSGLSRARLYELLKKHKLSLR